MIRKLILTGVILCGLLLSLYVLLHWGFERAYVGPNEALMVIKKFGDPLPADRIVVPADDTVVPPGSVGVVTRLTGEVGAVESALLTPASATQSLASRLVTGPKQRGILKDVLQPGIYYLNPRLVKVTIVPVGYDAITLEH